MINVKISFAYKIDSSIGISKPRTIVKKVAVQDEKKGVPVEESYCYVFMSDHYVGPLCL